MFHILATFAASSQLGQDEGRPGYLDTTAAQMLEEARLSYRRMGFSGHHIVSRGEGSAILATRAGTMKTSTLALRAFGYTVERHDGFLEVKAEDEAPPLSEVLGAIGDGAKVDLFLDGTNLLFEKFHPYLTPELLGQDALSARLDVEALPTLCAKLIARR